MLETSGHVEKFNDLMVKDVATGDCYRADKLLAEVIDRALGDGGALPAERREELKRIAGRADAMGAEELHAQLQALGVKAPATGNDLTAPFPFNLMFKTTIGPAGDTVGYLRPETAQGIFVNFRRLLEFNNGRLPFAAAQVGLAFRNEIAPRNGLIRVREFTLAEIEHFVKADEKEHAKFGSVAALQLPLYPRHNQVTDGKLVSPTLAEAVASGLINNQTLAYFMARTFLFLLQVRRVQHGGVSPVCARACSGHRVRAAHAYVAEYRQVSTRRASASGNT